MLSPSPNVLNTGLLPSAHHFMAVSGGMGDIGEKQRVKLACQCPGGVLCPDLHSEKNKTLSSVAYISSSDTQEDYSPPKSLHVAKLHQVPPGPRMRGLLTSTKPATPHRTLLPPHRWVHGPNNIKNLIPVLKWLLTIPFAAYENKIQRL